MEREKDEDVKKQHSVEKRNRKEKTTKKYRERGGGKTATLQNITKSSSKLRF